VASSGTKRRRPGRPRTNTWWADAGSIHILSLASYRIPGRPRRTSCPRRPPRRPSRVSARFVRAPDPPASARPAARRCVVWRRLCSVEAGSRSE
jgi:hypothetical protein